MVRSLTLVNELKYWYEVTLVCGGQFSSGFPAPEGFRLVQLPPVRLNAQEQLEAVGTDKPLHSVMLERKKAMLSVYEEAKPDVFLTDYFPFGKKEFVGELMPILKRCKTAEKPVLVACSLRDILEPHSYAKKGALDIAVSVCNAYYDAILVHSDPRVVRLQDSYPRFKELQVAVHYTGFIARASSERKHKTENAKGAVVSVGGGRVGVRLLRQVVNAFIQSPVLRQVPCTVVSGPGFPSGDFQELQQLVEKAPHIELIREVADLSELWEHAAFSISMGGYNTTMELLSTKIPALIIPYHNQNNSEQFLRATKLKALGLVEVFDSSQRDEEELGKAIEGMLEFRPATKQLHLNGVVQSVELLEDLYWEKSFHDSKASNS